MDGSVYVRGTKAPLEKVAEGTNLRKSSPNSEERTEGQSRSTIGWYADAVVTVSTGIALIGTRLNRRLEAGSRVNCTGFLPFPLGTRERSAVAMPSHAPEPVPCRSALFLG